MAELTPLSAETLGTLCADFESNAANRLAMNAVTAAGIDKVARNYDRARLLQRSNSRDAAARALRSATSTRLADRFGLRHESALDGLIAALVPHVDRTPEQLRALLGPAPVTSDQDLVRLAHDLDHLEKEIDR